MRRRQGWRQASLLAPLVIVVVALGLPARELLAAGRRILEVIET
jgi:hypothetical protein